MFGHAPPAVCLDRDPDASDREPEPNGQGTLILVTFSINKNAINKNALVILSEIVCAGEPGREVCWRLGRLQSQGWTLQESENR